MRFFFSFLVLIGILGFKDVEKKDEWCQRYAHDGFFNGGAIQSQLHSFLNEIQIKLLTSELTVQVPILCKGDFLIVRGCKPHACPLENYFLVINIQEKESYFCYWKAENSPITGKGDVHFYASTFSKPLKFKDIALPLGCAFTKEALESFVQDISSQKNKKKLKYAIKTLVKNAVKL